MSESGHNTTWVEQVGRLRAVQLDLMRRAPYRDFGLIPGPGASQQALDRSEETLGFCLPPSYRSFLAKHDGWTRFYDGASLLCSHQLGSPEHRSLANRLFSAAASPSARTPGGFRQMPQQLLVFGLDKAGITLFAFDLSAATSSEPPVTAWIGELGLKFSSFDDFLGGIAVLCETELRTLSAAEADTAVVRRRQPAAVSWVSQDNPALPLAKTG